MGELLACRRYHSSFLHAGASPDRSFWAGASRGIRVVARAATNPRPLGSMSDQTYDDGRARNLEELLRSLAERIRALDAEGRLLANPAELTRLIGDVKSELFHYEVRATYDPPEVAAGRRIVNHAINHSWQGTQWPTNT